MGLVSFHLVFIVKPISQKQFLINFDSRVVNNTSSRNLWVNSIDFLVTISPHFAFSRPRPILNYLKTRYWLDIGSFALKFDPISFDFQQFFYIITSNIVPLFIFNIKTNFRLLLIPILVKFWFIQVEIWPNFVQFWSLFLTKSHQISSHFSFSRPKPILDHF